MPSVVALGLMDTKGGSIAGLLMATVLWGVSFPLGKVLVGIIDPVFVVIIRFGLASAIVLTYLLLKKKPILKLFNNKILWILGITNGIGFALEFYGLTMTSASIASFLINVNVVFMAMFGAILLKERVTRKTLIGIFFGLAGVFLITTGGDFSTLTGTSALGNLIILVAGIVWAYSNIYNKKAVTELELSPIEVTESMIFISFLAVAPIILFIETFFLITPFTLGSIVYLTVFCTIIGFYLFYLALRKLTVVNAGLVLLFEIIVAVTTSFIFLGETIPPLGLLGGVFIAVGIILAS
jgi:drug/metabolite transporter (DMT)-like permease